MRRIVAAALAALALLFAPGAAGRGPQSIDAVAVAQLPAEARATLALIHQGGPYPHRQDNTIFGNRERLLPQHPRGYYREYTVATPGARDRGARRIITGGDPGRTGGDPPKDFFYTDDHYRSFHRIRE